MSSQRPDPTPAEIERAWRRPPPKPIDASAAEVSFVYRWQRAMWRITKVFLFVWFVGVIVFIALAIADVLLHLGWGNQPKHILGAAALLAFGVLALPFFWLVQSVVSAITRRIYGPERSEFN